MRKAWTMARMVVVWSCWFLTWQLSVTSSQGQDPSYPTNYLATIQAIEGSKFFVSPAGTETWVTAPRHKYMYDRDRGRTGERTRVTLQMLDQGVIRINENTTFLVRSPPEKNRSLWMSLWQGMAYFFHRGEPQDIEINSRTASASVEGTDFLVAVDEEGAMEIVVFDGTVVLRNDEGSVTIFKREQGIARPGQKPVKSGTQLAMQRMQWALHYPGALYLDDLNLAQHIQSELAASLDAYRAGNVLRAESLYPSSRQPNSPAEALYLASLWLAVGQVEPAEKLVQSIPKQWPSSANLRSISRLGDALLRIVAMVRGDLPEPTAARPPVLATEWLVASRAYQARFDLPAAVWAIDQALALAPDFGFAWAQRAELEFGRGHWRKTRHAAQKSLVHSPENAQAWAVQGFVWAAQDSCHEATYSFTQALSLDPGLGQAWLGRGLCRLRQGDIDRGLLDLEMAAAVEPQRALFRSYLGKAYRLANDPQRALHELALAKELDPGDPTPWLYSALMLQENNRINEGIEQLETSKQLNENRGLYRSRYLLDQDQAVRGANLATLYRDAGMEAWSLREAMKAVNTDYANYSAHLFLANSYNQLSDPGLVNLRYETARVSEYLLATLLAPVGAGVLSPLVSQYEYSPLFEQDGLHILSQTEYRSNGDWTQSAAQYGRLGDMSYSVEPFYRSWNGQRPNNDLEQKALGFKGKWQITPRTLAYIESQFGISESGDRRVLSAPESEASHTFRSEEKLQPILLAGWQHQWQPGVNTLFLGGWIKGDLQVDNSNHPTPALEIDSKQIEDTALLLSDFSYDNSIRLWQAELQQIFRFVHHTLVMGGRHQYGELTTRSRLTNSYTLADQVIDSHLRRMAGYIYDTWHLGPTLDLTAGLSYDAIDFPRNHRSAPLTEGNRSKDQFSFKGGAYWTPNEKSTLHAAYARSLGGLGFDQSFRLEPSQISGFNQSWRSLIPESVASASSAERFDTAGIGVQRQFPTRTYVNLQGTWSQSKVDRQTGVLHFLQTSEVVNSSVKETIDFHNQAFELHITQLIDSMFSAGIHYAINHSELDLRRPDIDSNINGNRDAFPFRESYESYLQRIQFFANINLPSGFVARVNANYYHQKNRFSTSENATRTNSSDFWLFDAFVGYRWFRRQAEVNIGVLNLADRTASLHPLNYAPELPRQRTFVATFRWQW